MNMMFNSFPVGGAIGVDIKGVVSVVSSSSLSDDFTHPAKGKFNNGVGWYYLVYKNDYTNANNANIFNKIIADGIVWWDGNNPTGVISGLR